MMHTQLRCAMLVGSLTNGATFTFTSDIVKRELSRPPHELTQLTAGIDDVQVVTLTVH